ncbi:MAG: hypothetical protein V3U69_04210, partial [Bacteroidota bacterium]
IHSFRRLPSHRFPFHKRHLVPSCVVSLLVSVFVANETRGYIFLAYVRVRTVPLLPSGVAFYADVLTSLQVIVATTGRFVQRAEIAGHFQAASILIF